MLCAGREELRSNTCITRLIQVRSQHRLVRYWASICILQLINLYLILRLSAGMTVAERNGNLRSQDQDKR